MLVLFLSRRFGACPFCRSHNANNPPHTKTQQQPEIGLAAEHGFFTRAPGCAEWHTLLPGVDFSWRAMALPILKVRVGGWLAVCVCVRVCVRACASVRVFGGARARALDTSPRTH